MSAPGRLRASEAWIRLLLRLYPAHFREEMGEALVEAYRDRFREARRRGGAPALAAAWLRALGDSLRNGPGERLRPSISWRRLGDWGRDSQRVARRLARAPVFTASMIGTLGIGLGAFAVVYAVVDEVLLEPLPYERPDDLYWVWRDYTWFDLRRGALAGTDVTTLRDAGGAVQAVVGLDRGTVTLAGAGDGEPQEVAISISDPDLFRVLGVEPLLGRGFADGEAGPGRPPVAVLGHDLWQGAFGGDPAVLGSEIRLDDAPYTVIGVMPPSFRFLHHASLGRAQGVDLYTTFTEDLAATNPGAGSYAGLIRARPGTPPEAVASAVEAVGQRVDERDFEGQGLRLYSVGMQPDLVAGVRPALVALALAGLLLVLVLAVNLATLLLARAAQREREFAISRALGADGAALARATVLEGAALGALGGMAGALAAVWATEALVALAPAELPRRETIAVDAGVIAVVVAVGAGLGLLAGAAPAVWAARTRLSSLLTATRVRGGGGQGRMRRGMVVAQVALALLLLSAGGLVLRSFQRLLQADLGFAPAGVLTLRVPVPDDRYPDGAALDALHDRIAGELAAIPGVEAVGAASALPLTADANQTTAAFPGAPGNTGDADRDAPLVDYFTTRPGYVEALGIEVLQGRAFAAERAAGASDPDFEGPYEAVIDRTLAERFFPGGDAVGATATLGGETLVVVGVVDHARQYDVHRDDRPQVYLRNDDFTESTLSWAVRTERDPLALASEARTAVWRVDPQLAVSAMRSMDQVVDESLRQERISMVLITGFSLGGLMLAAMGLYGVVAGSVDRRRHEIAVRLALGAERGQVLRLVIGDGMRLVALGLLVGVPGIWLSGRVIGGVLVGVSPFDPATLAAVAVALAGVALAACWLPARRVSEIEPAGLLRQD